MSVKILLLSLLLLLPTTVSGQSLFDNFFRDEDREKELQDSITVLLDDISVFIDYIEYLESRIDNITTLYENEKNNVKIRTIVKTETVEKIVVDTITVIPSGFNVNTVLTIPFEHTERMNGSIYTLSGQTSFKWDFDNNKPTNIFTSIDSFDMRLNVTTSLIKNNTYYTIDTQPTTPNIVISDNQNNILTENDYIKRVPTKLGIGLVGGFGFSYQGMTPYAGVGITYSFYDIGSGIRKLRNRR